MMRAKCSIFLLIVLLNWSSSAYALGIFSRACSIGELAQYGKAFTYAVLKFLELLGEAPRGSLTAISGASTDRQNEYHVLESITADYAEVRYYLYAANEIYRWQEGAIANTKGLGAFYKVGAYKSGWNASDVAPELADDPDLIFLHNRKYLYSARAGHPHIVTHWPKRNPPYRDDFLVVGKHYYFEPRNKVWGYIGESRASNCNLTEWAIETR